MVESNRLRDLPDIELYLDCQRQFQVDFSRVLVMPALFVHQLKDGVSETALVQMLFVIWLWPRIVYWRALSWIAESCINFFQLGFDGETKCANEEENFLKKISC